MKTYKTGFALLGKRVASLFALTGIILSLGSAATAQTVQTNLAVTVRHAPNLNGRVEGSLQQLLGEDVLLNSGFVMTGDLFLPGTPTLVLNGQPSYAGTIVGTGSSSPTGYHVTLNSGCSLRYLCTRINPVTLPTVPAPPQPTGTRSVTISTSGQSYGSASTLRDLTLNANVGQVAVPPGTYGTFTVDSGSGVVLGVAGGLQVVNYNLQNLNLNGSSTLKVVGPVVLTVANGFTANGTVGASNNPAWLQLQVASGGFTLNSGCTVYGLVLAPNGTVIVNGNSTLVGTSASDQFTLNSGGLVRWGGSSTQTNPPPVATPRSITLAENSSTNITLTGSDPQGRTLTFTLLTLPTHGTVSGTPPSVTYKPATNYFGSDAFTFKVNNGITDSLPATVSLTVTQVYYPPTAFPQSLTNFEDAALPVTLTGYDPQGYALTFSVLTQPAHGTLSGTAPNLTYRPATNYFGNDSFTFRVGDGVSNSLSATISITNKPVDDPPIVVAGPNQLIILPTNSVSLAGSVTYDVFPGTVDTVFWSKVSGPGTVTFSNPSNPLTTATFSQSGLYRLRLFASDSFLSASNDLFVTVDAPPVVNAGQTMTNTFPGTVTLSGVASDDGLPANGTLTVIWSKISGPGTVVFGNAATTNSTATFSTNGVYGLRLTADDGIATNHSDLTVIENLPPVVNAGTSILTNGLQAALNGSVTDDGLPGALLSSQWSQSSGPGTITFSDASATNTTVTASQSGTYILTLTAFDGAATNSSEVVVTFNLPPVVNAGPAQTVNFGTTVTLAGTVTDDQLPHNILTSTWTEVSGPGNAIFADTSLTNTTVTFDQPGIYTLRLTASDTLATTNADVVIRVNAAPVVDAGTNQVVTLGTLVTLAGSYTDDGISGSTVTTLWTQISGPAGAVFTDPTAASTTVSFSQSGVYVFQLTANDGLTNGSAQVTVIVNQAPTVSITADKLTVEMPDTVTLTGIISDDGLPNGTLTCLWNQVGGPGTATFSNPTRTNTTVSFNAAGTYTISLTANDSISTGSKNITLTVLATNQPPVVNAGPSQTNLFPALIQLAGMATDDGLPVGSLTTAWTLVSGPGTVTFDNPNATNTTATFSQSGVYVLRLTASDTMYARSSDVTITMDAAPVVNAGTNQIVTGTNQVLLSGTVMDDGLPLGTLSSSWSVASGPGTVSFEPVMQTNDLAGTAVTNEVAATATFSQPGVYVLRLTADDSLATNMAEVTITLNQAPMVDAGPNQTIQVGQSANLQGSVSDDGLPEGGSLSAVWMLVSGPGQLMFDDPYNPETSVHFSMAGTYVLRLTVRDTLATNSAETVVTVVPANQAPLVQVGPKQVVVLPANASLRGTVTDDGLPNGGTLTMGWSKVSGPGSVIFSAPDSANTTASFSEAGNYVLRLTASDSALSGYAEVKITVRTPAMNEAPVVSAGPDKVIGLTNVATLDGTVTDDGLPQGSTVTVNWSVIGGPGTVTFENSSVTNARATFSATGTYVLRLTASDSALSASSDVTVTVYPYNQPPVVDAGPDQTIIVPDPDVLIAGGLMPTNPAVELALSLLSVPHWNNTIGQPGLDSSIEAQALSWSGTCLVASGGFVASGTNFIGSVAVWDGTNWSGLFDYGLVCSVGEPYGNPAWHGENGYFANGSAVLRSTSRGNEVFINGGFLAPRHLDQGQETMRWDGTQWVTWGVQGAYPYYTSRQMLATSNMVYELFDLFKPTYVRTYNGPADLGDPNCLWTNVYTSDVDLMPTCYGLATWDGTNWGTLGDLMQIYQRGGWLTSVTVGNHGEVYIAGDFTLDTPTGVANCIAVWNGTNWASLGDGLTGRRPYVDIYGQLYYDHMWVNSLAVDEWGNLYVAGAFSHAGGQLVNGIAKWDGTNWSALGSSDGVGWNAEAVAIYGRDVYVAGGIQQAGGVSVRNIARWDGQRWLTMGRGPTNGIDGEVSSLAASPNGVFVGGSFGSAGGLPANNVAFWEYPPLPSRFAYLNGKVTDDGLAVGSVLTSVWTKQSGPGDVTFAAPTNPVTTATFSKAGTYVLRLTASDGEYSRFDEATVTVHGNEPPVVDAGSNKVVGVDGAVVMTGSVSDDGLPEGMDLEQEWTVINGPGTVTFDDPSDPETAVTFSRQGVYVLRLSANDTQFTTHSDVTIQVLSQNSAPSVQAWADNSTVVQPNPASLHGNVNDDGLPTTGTLIWSWSQVSGPGVVAFTDALSLNTSVQFPQIGTYVLRLTATDSQLSSSADVTVQVTPPGGYPSPQVIAGFNQQITMPASATLNGVVITNGASGVTRAVWSVLSGPGNVTFADPGSVSTTASFDTPGIYNLQLEFDQQQSYWWWTWWSMIASDHLFVTVNPPVGVNQAPAVYAGPSRTIPLGVPVQLRGQATDDGLPSGILNTEWQFVDGPAPVQFADSNSLVTTVIFTNAGQYDLQLWASDSQLESVSGVSFTVVDLAGGGNHPPLVDAGTNQTISSGSVAQLNGTVTDDGLPGGVLNYYWTVVRGPDVVTFDDNQSLTPTVTFNTEGIYVFRLHADDGALINEADVTINIDHLINQPPTVDAGASQTILLPTNSLTLNGSVTDDGLPAGGTLSYHWEIVDAPGDVIFDDTNSLTPTVTFPNPPIDYSSGYPVFYQLLLVADDSELSASNEITIAVGDPAIGNHVIEVNAGPDQTITLPDGVDLNGSRGSVSSDGGSQWKQVSGPGIVTFDAMWYPQTTAHFSKAGVYRLRLTAFDDGAFGSDDVTITVLPPANVVNAAPTVDAGPSVSIPIQIPTAALSGFVADDGLPTNGVVTSTWSVVSGPGNVMFADTSSSNTTAVFDSVGTYVLRLTADDSALANSSDVTVMVYDPTQANQPPVVDAGTDQTIVLPQDVALNGTVSDDGLPGPSLYQYWALWFYWNVVSGPYQVDFADSGALQTTAHFYVPGDYILQLTAGDGIFVNNAAVTIHVLSVSNQPPMVQLNAAASVALGTGAALGGIVLDDGLPAGGALTVQWSVASGPGTATFTQSNNNFPYVSTVANFSSAGDYVLQLVAGDGELSTTGQVAITVFDLYQGNQPPVINAGPNRSATTRYPIALQGTASDDGLPAGGTLSTMWSVNSGPGQVRFSNATQTNSTATFYLAGTYMLQLSAGDSQLSSVSQVIITVNDPTNEPPLVYAGPAQTITRPAAALLGGVVMDDGLPLGYPLTYQWTKVSGPGTVTFATDTTTNANLTPWLNVDYFDAFASATFSANGTYVLRLTASDTQFTNTDEVTITALPGVNTAPQVDAGPDQSIVLPNAAILHTGVTDDGLPDGTLEIVWTAVSGPGPVSFSTVNGVYRAGFASSGAYTLRLTASDGEFTSTDDVNVTVYDPTQAPVVQINLPLDGDIITAPTQVVGTVSSAILQFYVLEYRLADSSSSSSSNWTAFTTGNSSVQNGPLGVLDPTLSLNGIYELRLTATDISGRTATTDPITVIFDRNLKIGQFTISFNDLAVPVPGLPLQITRTYDSRAAAAGVRGDFGTGWTMDIRNVRLQKNRPLSRNWDEYTTGSADDLSLAYHLDPGNPRIVIITFPGGRVEKFQFTPYPMDQALEPIEYPQWNFTPMDNTLGTLEPASIDDPDGNFLYFAGSIPGNADLYDLNYFFNWFDSTNTLADLQRYPTLFRYTSAEGYKYLIDEIEGLQSVTDPNGNTLVIATNGLIWSNPNSGTNSVSVAFQRDVLGRITNIVDAAGNAMSYQYDTNNNLVTFTDRTGQTNGFAYTNVNFPHYLTSITDARGVTPIQNEYDADGRLIGNVDAFGNAVTYGHDLANNREYVTNQLGFVTASDYDNNGNVTHTIAADGGETFTTYDDDGNVLTVTDPLGRTTSYTYDGQDNRTSVTDPLGNSTRFTYGAMRRVTSVTDPRGNSITNAFDALGNLLSMSDPLGHVTTFSYDQNGQPVGMQNALGQTMTFGYDSAGRLASEQDALGHETDYQRDSNGNLLAQTTTRTTTGGLQTLTVQFQYDEQSRLTNSIFPDGSSAQTIYNAIGKPATTIDQQGRQTSMEYDALGRVTRTDYTDGSSESSGYDAEGRRVFSTNRLGQVTRYEYDAVGRLVHTLYSDGTATTNYFDLAGQLIVSTDANGNNTFYGYDAAGRSVAVTNALGQVSRSFYDASGNLTNSVDALGRSTTFVYDALNRRVQTVFADHTTQTTWFDELGRRTYEQDQAGKTTAFDYDTLGRLTAVTNAMGYVTSYAYDELGQQISQTDANLHTTTFEYDSLGRRVKRTLPGNQVETYAYNIGGLLTNKTDFDGYATTYQYDQMNRLVAKLPSSILNPPSSPVYYSYNVLGLRTNMTDASGATAYVYDDRNRLAQKTKTFGGASYTSTLTYGYDAIGNLTGITSSDPNGVNVGYEYDALNRLSAVNDAAAGTTAYGYDAVGNLAGYIYPNNVNSTYTYDSLNRLTNLASGRLLTPIANYAYTVGPAGNRLTATETIIRDPLNPVPRTINRVYTYDNIYRLTGETINGAPSSGAASYGYDPVGNRLTRNSTLPTLLFQNFTFDANDRLNTDQYDANGNTLVGAGFGQTQADQYDFENRLVTRHTPQATINIAYDGDGNRVSKTVTTATNTVTTFYVVDDLNPSGYAQVLEELSILDPQSSIIAVTTVYTYGHTLISEDRRTGNQWATSFYGYDGHNNVRYLTDMSGNVTDTYDYDAFGNLTAASGDTVNYYLFTGEQFDLDLGLYYLRARYHNPDTGRFWTEDSYEGNGSDPASLHKYTYCDNNPVNGFDRSGHDFDLASMAFVSNMSVTARVLLAGLTATIGGVTSALDTYVATDGQATAEQLGQSYVRGYWIGAAFGVAGGFLPVATAIGGAGLGGWGVGQAINANNPRLILFRALTLSLFTSIGARAIDAQQVAAADDYYYTGQIPINKPTFTYEENVPGEVKINAYDDNGDWTGGISVSKALDGDAAIINSVVVGNSYRGQGLSTALYGEALARLGWPSQVRGEPWGSNLNTLCGDDMSGTYRASSLENFGYTEHSYDPSTKTMTSSKP
jgi:RHS repeat-associated protein